MTQTAMSSTTASKHRKFLLKFLTFLLAPPSETVGRLLNCPSKANMLYLVDKKDRNQEQISSSSFTLHNSLFLLNLLGSLSCDYAKICGRAFGIIRSNLALMKMRKVKKERNYVFHLFDRKSHKRNIYFFLVIRSIKWDTTFTITKCSCFHTFAVMKKNNKQTRLISL